MALVCFASQKGAPGVTLTALAVAAAWPADGQRRKLFLEADASGGALALRYGLGLEPGLVTLAVAAHRNLEPGALWDHAQELPGGMPAIVGPDNPDRATAVLATGASSIARSLADRADLDVIVDLGRLGPDAPATDLVRHADLTLMVTRPNVEHLQPAAQRMRSLTVEAARLAWILIGERPHTADEVEEAFGFEVAGIIADDRRGASALEHGAQHNRLRRSPLARSAASLATSLAERLHGPDETDGAEPPVRDTDGTASALPLAMANGAIRER
ncbi:MAG: hypothetical protein GY704_04690 [Phycisphaeraceae bacterium]|nr:hypothetical protein [Phycisphaeraceae bacterium]